MDIDLTGKRAIVCGASVTLIARRRGDIQDRILEELCANIDSVEQLDWKKAEGLLA